MSTEKQSMADVLDAKPNQEASENATPSIQQVLQQRMQNGVVGFTYRKVDGGLRAAYGTTKESIVPIMANAKIEKLKQAFDATMATLNEAVNGSDELDVMAVIRLNKDLQDSFAPKPTKEPKAKAENLITYYDIESADWRSFRGENLITVMPPISIANTK